MEAGAVMAPVFVFVFVSFDVATTPLIRVLRGLFVDAFALRRRARCCDVVTRPVVGWWTGDVSQSVSP